MNILGLRKKMREVTKNIADTRGKKKNLENELDDLMEEQHSASKNYEISRQRYAKEAQERYTSKMLRPLEDRRTQLNSDLARIDKEYEYALSELTVDSRMAECSDQQSILAEVKGSIDKLHEFIVEILGQRFYDELERQLESGTVIRESDELSRLIDYFNVCEAQIEKISMRSGKLTKVMDKIQQVVVGTDTSRLESGTKTDIPIVVGVMVIVLISFKYLFPIYFSAIVVAAAINLRRHYLVFRILLLQKTVKDNVAGIEDAIRQEVLKKLEEEKAALKGEYDDAVNELNRQLASTEDEIRRMTVSCSNFRFDDSQVRKDFELSMSQKSQRITNLNLQITDTDKLLQQYSQELENLKAELDKAIATESGSLLDPNKVGTSYKFDNKFIQDTKGGTIKYFTHKETSTLFLYDEYESAINFVKLFCFQLRTKLNPMVYTIDLVDPISMGSDFRRFQPSNEDNVPAITRLFRIYNSEEEFKNDLKLYTEEIDKRMNLFSREYGDISAYNDYMLSIESATEPYRFIFIICPSSNFLTSKDLLQPCKNGSKAGVFFHIFYSEKDFYALHNNAYTVADGVDSFFMLSSSDVQSRARDWINDKIDEELNTKK